MDVRGNSLPAYPSGPALGALRESITRLTENRLALFGAIVVFVMFSVALLAPYLAHHDPSEIAVSDRLAPLSSLHPFGTDQFGRDIFSRVIYGARVSVVVGLIAVSLGLALGVFLGAVSGYFSKVVDNVLMRIVDAIMAFPGILLALALVAVWGPSLASICFALGIRYMPSFARLVRASVLKERDKEYVEAAKVQGESDLRVLCRQILPNCTAPLIIQVSLDFAHAIIAESSLSFLGLGLPPPTPSWGNMLDDARTYMTIYPWGAIFPGLAISLAVLGFNFLGDGLRDILDPRLAEERSGYV
jgi:ABC-type dipeptide/oligopeptide/nickel transport system permease subunit